MWLACEAVSVHIWRPSSPTCGWDLVTRGRDIDLGGTVKQTGTPWDIIHSSERSDWRTPPRLFYALNSIFKFALDAAASEDNALCPAFYTEKDDSLTQPWTVDLGRYVWCNPPYGRDIYRWIDKAISESRRGSRIMMLVFASTETRWFRMAAENAYRIIFLTGRLKFVNHKGEVAGPAPKGSCLIEFLPRHDLMREEGSPAGTKFELLSVAQLFSWCSREDEAG